MNLTAAAEELISDLAETLEIPEERYESADRSYQSLATWLDRPGSRFEGLTTRVYTQGSFRLGTAIRPLNGEEHYDLDIVCEFEVNKERSTQQVIQETLGYELKAYAARFDMEPPEQWERCWTLNYADSAQFHMDVLPSTPDGQRQISILASRELSNPFTAKSIAITDSKHGSYRIISSDWPTSNPDGYADWFYQRMKPLLEKRRKVGSIFAEADVADIPKFRFKTPLQTAVQILKRHRDIQFSDSPDSRPSSIIITTLAAHAYGHEERITDALYAILDRMDSSIEYRADGTWIGNPTDPRENFADSWKTHPERRTAFLDWLSAVRSDFANAARLGDTDQLIQALAPRMGRQLMEKAASIRPKIAASRSILSETKTTTNALSAIASAPHRKPIPWIAKLNYFSEVISATQQLSGFRAEVIPRSGAAVQSGSSLRFTVKTNAPKPYKVYWQIVNTGKAASAARNLRGGFEEDRLELGYLLKKETARYPGTHSIECLIVKDGHLVSRTSPFIVNII